MQKLNVVLSSLMILFLTLSLIACDDDFVIDPEDATTISPSNPDTNPNGYTNITNTNERMLLVLCAPSINNDYYADDFDGIIDFMINYANTVMHNDNIIVLADAATMPYLSDALPADVLLQADVQDIWMRDFTTVLPNQMVQFAYSPSYLGNAVSSDIQWSFVNFTDEHNLTYHYADWILDGGNIVDNNSTMAIATERFLEDNNIGLTQAQNIIKNQLGVDHVSIIPYDDDFLAHADGMVMFIDDNTVVINTYEEPFRSELIEILEYDLPGINIVEIPVAFEEGDFGGFASACGVNLNSTVTNNYIYTPIFNNTVDANAVAAIQANTSKEVKTVNAENVCFMGGSVRCLTWQLTGSNADKLVEAARE